MEFAERTFISADGLRLYARDYPGEGGGGRLPVVCLHGLTRNSRDFEDLARRIAAGGHRVLVPDILGRARPAYDTQPLNYTPQTYAEDVLALLSEANETRAIFIGTSMGGVVTMMVAAAAPKAVVGALLNDVGPEIAPEGLARILANVNAPTVSRTWDEAVGYTLAANALAFPANGMAEWNVFARRLFRPDGGRWMLDYDPEIMAPFRTVQVNEPPLDPWPLFTNLAASRPIALLRGEKSDVLTADIADRMKACAPHLEVTEVPQIGHAPSLMEPNAVRAVFAFLSRCPGSGTATEGA